MASACLPARAAIHIEGRSLHFDGHNAHLLPRLVADPAAGHIAVVAVEAVRGQNIADVVRKAQLLRRLNAGFEHVIVRDGRERAGQMVLARPVGIGAGPLSNDDITQVDILLHGAGRADAHNIFHAKHSIQFPRIDTDGRHAHARRP